MAIGFENVVLRTVAYAPLTTVNRELTWTEADTNVIILYQHISDLEAAGAGNFTAYDNGTTYSDDGPSYVSYDNNIWKYINAVPQAGVTPGTDPLTWEIVSVGAFAHEQNTDQYLDYGGAHQVSAEDIYNLVNAPPLTGVLYQGSNPLTEPLIFIGDKTGFGGTPSGAVHFVLPNDATPLGKTVWTNKDAVFGEVGDQGKAMGVSYTTGTSTINLNFLEPAIQWLNAQLNASTIAFYSGGSVLGFFQSAAGKVGIGTNTPIADTQITIKGIDDSDDDFQLKTTNGSGDVILSVRNDGLVNVNGDLAIPDGNFQYFKGNESTDGSIRVGMVGVELVAQRRESGTWVTQNVIIS